MRLAQRASKKFAASESFSPPQTTPTAGFTFLPVARPLIGVFLFVDFANQPAFRCGRDVRVSAARKKKRAGRVQFFRIDRSRILFAAIAKRRIRSGTCAGSAGR
jgi:hypothetical protein